MRMIGKILCGLGLHKWDATEFERRCKRCQLTQHAFESRLTGKLSWVSGSSPRIEKKIKNERINCGHCKHFLRAFDENGPCRPCQDEASKGNHKTRFERGNKVY